MSARLLVLPVGAVAAVLTTRLINEALGPQSFAVYALVAGVPLLFPFADLGLGAAITNAASTARADPIRFQAILRRCLRISFFSAFIIAAASTFLGVAGLWSGILGLSDPSLNAPITVAMILFGFSIPGGLGKSIFLGLGRNTTGVIIQGLIPVLSLCVVGGAIGLGAQTGEIVAVSSLGTFVINWVGFIFAAVSMPGTWSDYHQGAQHRVMGEVVRTAMPMLVFVAGLGVLLQGGRLVLSHTSTLQQVAVYAALWAFFQPLLSVVQTAGVALWPRFAAARAAGRVVKKDFRTATFTCALIGLGAGFGLTLVGPVAVRFATAGHVEATYIQCAILGGVLAVQGAVLPAGMVLTFPRGLWLQSVTAWAAVGIVLTIGIWASPQFGATGPMLGLLAALTFGQAIPTIISAARYLDSPSANHGR